ncbi:MAG: efflux RND transporter periplasmic adaptor subunit [bacterium]|nr:efflux RND transporter periplasmic adaptor subunit [bacterium]
MTVISVHGLLRRRVRLPKRNRCGRNIVAATNALLIACLLGITGCPSAKNDYVDPPPPTVTVAQPLFQDVTIFVEENGETEPVGEAEVRARVSGFVQKIDFRPGQKVTAGQLLYEIEPDQYRADLDSALALLDAARSSILVAQANQVRAEAEVLRTERDFRRQEELIKKSAIAEADFDAALSARDSAVANLEAIKAGVEAAKAEEKKAQAAVAQAQLNLDYTQVKAPIDGFVTKTDIKEGNLVDFGSQLASIVDRSQIFVNFNINDRLLLRLIRQEAAAADGNPSSQSEVNSQELGEEAWRQLPVFVRTEGPAAQWIRGHLNYVAREGVDQGTGTFALRAILEEPSREIVPGLFVQVRLPIEQVANAMLIPLKAIQRSQLGDAVIVVDAEGIARRKSVQLGPELDDWVIVEQGLEAKDQVIIEGLMKARPGSKVETEVMVLSTNDAPILDVEDLPSVNQTSSAANNTADSETPSEPEESN